MRSLSSFSRTRPLLVVLSAGALSLLHWGVALAATNDLPQITRNPVSDIAGLGESFFFSVSATSVAPLQYQWLHAGTNLPGMTTSSLLLTNITSAQDGHYAVSVSNTNGNVQSPWVRLQVQSVFTRRLTTGRVLASQIVPQVGVPVVLRGNGWENAVSFSLAYNSNAFANPVFIPGYAGATVTTDTSQTGVVGISMQLPAGSGFYAGYIPIGIVEFEMASGANLLQGGLAFANSPIPITATNQAQQALQISASVEPQFVLVSGTSRLDRQSGLFKQQLTVSNPGGVVMTNVNVFPATVSYDTLTNTILFYDGAAALTNLPYSDPLVPVGRDCGCGFVLDSPGAACEFGDYLVCATNASSSVDSAVNAINLAYAQIQNLAPGESRTLTMEYYVSDHVTVSRPLYTVYLAADRAGLYVLSPRTPVTIIAARYVNRAFLLEFPTKVGSRYYVDYADTSNFTNALTAFPPVDGTGTRLQWMDEGPPKTISPPVNGSRFYRVYSYP